MLTDRINRVSPESGHWLGQRERSRADTIYAAINNTYKRQRDAPLHSLSQRFSATQNIPFKGLHSCRWRENETGRLTFWENRPHLPPSCHVSASTASSQREIERKKERESGLLHPRSLFSNCIQLAKCPDTQCRAAAWQQLLANWVSSTLHSPHTHTLACIYTHLCLTDSRPAFQVSYYNCFCIRPDYQK